MNVYPGIIIRNVVGIVTNIDQSLKKDDRTGKILVLLQTGATAMELLNTSLNSNRVTSAPVLACTCGLHLLALGVLLGQKKPEGDRLSTSIRVAKFALHIIAASRLITEIRPHNLESMVTQDQSGGGMWTTLIVSEVGVKAVHYVLNKIKNKEES